MNNNEFNYTYKAPTERERREIEAIRRHYLQNGDTQSGEYKLERIRKLNNRVNGKATALSLVAGVLGLLIFGLGFSMVLEWQIIVGGIVVAILGIPPTAIAYPLYNRLIKKGKDKYGEEIIRLSNELLNQSNGEK